MGIRAGVVAADGVDGIELERRHSGSCRAQHLLEHPGDDTADPAQSFDVDLVLDRQR
jgi:hypothetical protein